MARGGDPVEKDAFFKYPGHQHSAEWYLFSDLNRPSHERVGSAVTRVLNPEEADVFYLPFFSSLSLVVNPIRPGNVSGERHVYDDERIQVPISFSICCDNYDSALSNDLEMMDSL